MGSGPSGTPRRVRPGYRCRIWCGGRLGVCAPGRSRTGSLSESAPGELARIGSNLNQIARWANIHKEDVEALEVVAHLVAIERALEALGVEGEREP